MYNEIDPFASSWLERLVETGHVRRGRVERRSVSALRGDDCTDAQCHFFAGIGGWSHALRLAGWPDDEPVWTGSCPCQPFSQAGKRGGFDDERHLWPAWFRLIQECRPPVVFGEQVASKDGLAWFDAVQADLESAGYAVGAADLCAAGVGSPHIRQRLYFVGVANDYKARRGVFRGQELQHRKRPTLGNDADRCGQVGGVADDDDGEFGGQRGSDLGGRNQGGAAQPRPGPGGGRGSFWSSCEWVLCSDGKTRPVEPGTFPLAHGVPNRVGRLRGYGNAIVAPLAAEFIRSVMDVLKAR